MSIEERSDVVYQIIELAKNNLLNQVQKQKVYDIVISLDNRTEIQKQRFLLYYNLNINQKNIYRLCDLARECNVSSNAIRCSLGRIRNALVNLRDDKILELQEILNEYKSSKKNL